MKSLMTFSFKNPVKNVLLYATLLFTITFSAISSHAQKHCDLALHLLAPANDAHIPYGDTAYLYYSITNLGPDNIDETADTLYIGNSVMPAFRVIWSDIAVGDSITDTIMQVWNNTPEEAPIDICLYLVPEWNVASADSVQTNDTSCVHFILEGKDPEPNSIADIRSSSPADLHIFPNPARSEVSVILTGNSREKPAVAVYDLSGRLVIPMAGVLRRSDKEMTIDVSALTEGIYLLKLSEEGQARYGKLMIR